MNSLLKLIERGENEGLEFKESLRLKEDYCDRSKRKCRKACFLQKS